MAKMADQSSRVDLTVTGRRRQTISLLELKEKIRGP
jgi:hypothetical protein